MPCDSRHSKVLGFGFALLQTILLLSEVSLPARSQQPRDRPAPAPPANTIDRWNRMSPEERERELAKLPPARARLIRQRIAAYNHMRPEEREALRERYETFSQLPPDRQQIVRERLREF